MYICTKPHEHIINVYQDNAIIDEAVVIFLVPTWLNFSVVIYLVVLQKVNPTPSPPTAQWNKIDKKYKKNIICEICL